METIINEILELQVTEDNFQKIKNFLARVHNQILEQCDGARIDEILGSVISPSIHTAAYIYLL